MTSSRYRLSRRAALGAAGAAAGSVLIPLPGRQASAQMLDKVSFETNWRAEGEHGGYYQAVAAGIYRKYGIDCDLRMGGPQISNSKLLRAGAVDMIMSGGFEALNYVKENVPLVCIAAILQKDPQVLLAHPGVGNDSFPQLKGKTIVIPGGGTVAYWEFLKAKFGYTADQARPDNNMDDLGPFLADKNLVEEGYITSEPYEIRQAGIEPVVLLVADAGFENYAETISTSRKFITEKKDLAQRFVTASLEGWAQYLKGGPQIEAANRLIKQANPKMTDGEIAYSLKVMNERGIVMSGDALTLGIGAMTDARWARFYASMVEVGVLPKGLDPKKAYTLEFVNKGVGKP
jgi:NitT/TauT family transport system substrate-binding protein